MDVFTILRQLNFEKIDSLGEKLNAGLNEVAYADSKRGGYTTLLPSMTDPDIIEGLNTASIK